MIEAEAISYNTLIKYPNNNKVMTQGNMFANFSKKTTNSANKEHFHSIFSYSRNMKQYDKFDFKSCFFNLFEQSAKTIGAICIRFAYDIAKTLR